MSADRGSKLEQKLMHTEEKLQAEQVAHSKLQADVTLERSQAALIKVTALRASLQGAGGRELHGSTDINHHSPLAAYHAPKKLIQQLHDHSWLTWSPNISAYDKKLAQLSCASLPARRRFEQRLLLRMQAELGQMLGEIAALSTRYEQAEQQQLQLKAEQQHLKLALTDAEAAAADAAVEVRAATAKAERLQQELQLTK